MGSIRPSQRLAGMYRKSKHITSYFIFADFQLGLVGLGNIGSQIASLAQALGFKRIIYHTRSPRLSSPFEHVSLDTLYDEADAVLLTCPLTKETVGLINDAAFEKMKEGVVLVNVARGPVVDDEALVRALASGKGWSLSIGFTWHTRDVSKLKL